MWKLQPASSPARQRKAKTVSFGAPVAGWIANRSLANPDGANAPQGAEILDNMFPTTTGAILRRGCVTYTTIGAGDLPVVSLFKYAVGNNRRFFAANQLRVYDITLSTSPSSAWEGEGGNWSTVQFATSGDTFLIGVNGVSSGFIYDGVSFGSLQGGVPEITFPAGVGLTTADLIYVWVYKNRLFFVEKESLSVWYLPVDQVGGELTELPLGGNFGFGGSLLLGQTWSLEGGGSGGLSEQCVFLTTEGEVLAFQGTDPAEASSWQKVGLYRIGTPLGTKGIIRAGGDLVIATSTGAIPLSKAIQVDLTALAPMAVSAPIDAAWTEAYASRGSNWQAIVWSEGQLAAFAPPTTDDTDPIILVANAITGAWCRFTGWKANAFVVFNGRLYFGSDDGKIVEAMVGGSDNGMSYTGAYLPLFTDLGAPDSTKIAGQARITVRSAASITERVSCRFDFNRELPSPPDATTVALGSEWDGAIWNESLWAAGRSSIVTQRRHSVSGLGYRIAAAFQVTSASTVPLDAEIVSIDVTYTMGDAFA